MTPRMSIIASAIRRIFAGGAGTGGTGSVDQGDPFWSNVVLNMRMEATGSADPHWSSVVLAMHMDGANDGSTFTDEKAHTMTLTGTPVTKTAVKQFGTASAYFTNNDKLVTPSSTDYAFGTGDFTVEFWVYFDSAATMYFCSSDYTVSNFFYFSYNTVANRLAVVLNPGGALNVEGVSSGAWHHVALSRNGSTFGLFVDGVVSGTSVTGGAMTIATQSMHVGGTSTSISSSGDWLVGYIDDLRITKGVGRYTGNFTPATAAFLEVAATDPYWSSVVLGMHMDGVDNGTVFTDVKGKAVTVAGNSCTKTATKKFGTASAYFDGDGDYLSLGSLDAGTFDSDFTFECWIKPEVISADRCVFDSNPSSGGMAVFAKGYNLVLSKPYVADYLTCSSCLTVGQWQHIAIVRYGTMVMGFVNGVKINEASIGAVTFAIGVPQIGLDAHGNFQGHIDDLRITKGVGRYTTTFTPPTTAFPETAAPTDDTGKTVTVVGNAAISTTQKKYGSSSCYFDGAGDYLTIPDSVDLQLDTGDFTMEMWIYMPSYPASGTYMVLASKYQNASTRLVLYLGENTSTDSGIRIGVNNGVTPLVYGSADGTFTLASQGLTTGVWHHIAVVRNSGKITGFMNGTALTKTGNPGYDISYPGANLHVGAQNGGIFFNGYIDDLRITKGIARYTANFTPAAISSGPMLGDPYYGYTTLLLRMNGADMSTTFTDESHTPKTVTRVGDTQLKTAVKKYGTASGYFDGVGDYLTVAGTSDFVFGTGDFTIELWVNTTDTNPALVDFYSAGNNGWQILLNGSGQLIWYTTAMVKTGSIAVNTGVWKHVAVVRHSGLLYFFVDGVMDGSSITHTTDLNYATPILAVGAQVYSRNEFYDLNGYIDDLRITKGIARYTSTFTPPPPHILGVPPVVVPLYSRLMSAFAFSGPVDDKTTDPAATGEATWVDYFSEFVTVAIFAYAKTSSAPADTGVLATYTLPFDTKDTYRIAAQNGSWSNDACPFCLEFMTADGTVIACIKTTGLGSYQHVINYGATKASATNAVGGSGYTCINGELTFTSTNVVFTNTAVSNYINSFSVACAALTITQVRVSDVRAYSTYSGGGAAHCVLYRVVNVT